MAQDLSRGHYGWHDDHRYAPATIETVVAWTCALAFPLLVAAYFRGKRSWIQVVATLWTVAVGFSAVPHHQGSFIGWLWNSLAVYVLGLAGSIALVLWGLDEQRKERVNIGMAGCAITILTFYFSNVTDKMGRSAALMGGGLLFLLAGWGLESTRRKLVARIAGGGQ
jgi:peptidoglycan/LPS O-acetylase OafA/YrhL